MRKQTKLLIALIFALVAFCALSVCVSAESGTCGENLNWDLTDGVLTITGEGEMADWSLSSHATWYDYRTSIIEVEITEGVTSIGDCAFLNCTNLKSVSISDSVKTIGDDSFWNCSELEIVNIGIGVKNIGNRAFSGYNGLVNLEKIEVDEKNLRYSSEDGVLFDKEQEELIIYPAGKKYTSYKIPDSVTNIDDRAFYYCTSLRSVNIPAGVTSIGNEAFSNCTSLTSVSIPVGVTGIGNWTFSKCTSLTSVNIFGSIVGICEGVFSGCKSLIDVSLPDSVTIIGHKAFFGCTGIKSIVIPKSVTSIDSYAFSNCTSLASMSIPDGVTSIGDWAFSYCTSLTSVSISDSVTTIGNSAFVGCTGLANVYISDLASWCEISFEDYTANPLYYAKEFFLNGIHISELVIPNAIISICNKAFYGFEGFTKVTIGKNVTSIGDMAFKNCVGLMSVTIGNSVISIGNGAFEDCSKLTSVTIGNNVTRIGNYAFDDCPEIQNVYYSGTSKQWESIEVGAFNWDLTDAKRIYITSVEHIEINKKNIELYTGETTTVTVIISPQNAQNQNVTWSSSDKSVAIVENGIITAVGKGKALITVTTEDGGFTAECHVTVNVKVKGVTINGTEAEICVGEELVLKATVLPECATNKKVNWYSSNTKVAKVIDGVVTGIAEGKASIIVMTADGGYTAICTVIVLPVTILTVNVTGVTFDKITETVSVGNELKRNAKVLPENATNKNITYFSADVNVATVENGVVKGVSEGSTVIIAITEDGGYSAVCNVTVVAGKSGDADGDGKVTVYDAVTVLGAVAGVTTPSDSFAVIADVDGNGVLSVNDAMHILKYVARIIPAI